jgi:hypothetical protein
MGGEVNDAVFGKVVVRRQMLDLGLGGACADPQFTDIGADAASNCAQLIRRLGQRCLQAELCEIGNAGYLRHGSEVNCTVAAGYSLRLKRELGGWPAHCKIGRPTPTRPIVAMRRVSSAWRLVPVFS